MWNLECLYDHILYLQDILGKYLKKSWLITVVGKLTVAKTVKKIVSLLIGPKYTNTLNTTPSFVGYIDFMEIFKMLQ
jgi:hypothetical protein